MRRVLITSILLTITAAVCFAESGKRILTFPEDKSVGVIYIEAPASDPAITYDFVMLEPTNWEYLCQAQGQVTIEGAKRVSLFVNESGLEDLSWITALKPDDLYQLSLPQGAGDKHMPYISGLTGLKSLNLHPTNVTSIGIKSIEGLKNLEYIRVPERMDNSGLAVLAGLKSLKNIYFTNSRVTNSALANLEKLPELQYLSFTGDRQIVDNKGLAHLAQIKKLTHLLIAGKKFTSEALMYVKDIENLEFFQFVEETPTLTDGGLRYLANHQKLETLDLYHCTQITGRGLAYLKDLPSLKKLVINHSKINDEDLANLVGIKSLRHLELPMQITDKGLEYVGRMSGLTNLIASNCLNVSDTGIRSLSNLNNLKVLEIRGNKITDEGVGEITKHNGLVSLYLAGPLITNDGLAKLNSLKSLKKLSLYTENTDISAISRLNQLSDLRQLYIVQIRRGISNLDVSALKNLEILSIGLHVRDKTYFKDADLACLEKLGRLQQISLGPRQFSDSGMKYLTGLKNMQRLNIGGPKLTDEGLQYLKNMTKLSSLAISDGDITSKGLKFLEPLKNISYLNINSAYTFDPNSLMELRKKLPNLRTLQTS